MRSPEDLIDIYLKSTKLGCAKLYCFVFWFDCESDDVFFARLQPVIQPFIEKKAARAARAFTRRPYAVEQGHLWGDLCVGLTLGLETR